MKHKVSDLEGALLDAAVAKAEGFQYPAVVMIGDLSRSWKPSTEWQDGGQIIEREGILLIPCIEPDGRTVWSAHVLGVDRQRTDCWMEYGKQGDGLPASPLIAAMRAYVASKFGEEIDL